MYTAWGLVGGSLYLLLRLTLGLAFVGAFCRRGAARAGWFGFALFGWIYMDKAFVLLDESDPSLPTQMLLDAVDPGIWNAVARFAPSGSELLGFPFVLWHCLWALVAAFLGGFLARSIFCAMVVGNGEPSRDARPAGPRCPRRWGGHLLLYGSALEFAVLVVLGGAILSPELWAGFTYLLTWSLIALAALEASAGQTKRRVRWLAAAVVGASYLLLVFGRTSYSPWPNLPTVELLDDIRPSVPKPMNGYPAGCDVRSAANAKVYETLDRKVRMHYVEETPLEDVLKDIQKQTADADGTSIPILLGPPNTPGSHRDGPRTIRSVDLDDVALRTSLVLCLDQLDHTYHVRDGMLVIHLVEDDLFGLPSTGKNAYQIVGHCVLALIAAGVGGAVAPLVCSFPRRRQPAVSRA